MNNEQQRVMDPNAALDKIRSIVRFTRGPSADMLTPAELLEDLVGAVDNLDERLSKGGALPDAWRHHCDRCGDVLPRGARSRQP